MLIRDGFYLSKILLLLVLMGLLTACQSTPQEKIYNVRVFMVEPQPHLVNTFPVVAANTCRIMCYSHDAKHGMYSLGNNIYAMGKITVPGKYDNRGVCRPTGYAHKDLSTAKDFRSLCNVFIKHCKNNCWAGGNA